MFSLKDKKAWSSYIRLLSYCKPYKIRLAAALACMILSSVFGIIPPWLIKNIVDDVLINKEASTLNLLAIGIITLYILKALFGYGHMYLMTWVGQKVVIDIRLELYDHTQRLSLAKLYSKRSGEFLSRITNDVAVLQNILASVVVDFVVQGCTFIGIICFLLFINWKLTLITFIVTPLAVLVIDKASSKLREVGGTIQEKLAMVAAIAQEALSSIRIVRAFVTEDKEYARFEYESNKHFKAVMKGTQVRGLLEGTVEVILISALAFILWFGGRDVINGKLTAGALLAFLTYIGLLVQPIRVLSRVISTIQQGVASADRVFEILDEKNEVPLPENPLTLTPMSGQISFKDVWFAYNDKAWVLKGLDFEIERGQKVAVVGSTGAGKSTLADLVMRFYDPQKGTVLIDGTDIKQLELKSYRRQIGVVPQDPVLMKGTLAYNIGYGYEGVTDEDLVRAAETAGILSFIRTLPDGFDTAVGERGVTLSGGQRQRIAIARAVVRDPRILIMDEATSSLDALVEQQVQDAMRKAMLGRTSIIIAHRLSTIRDADRIAVLSGGKLVEQGTHDELISIKGHYFKLFLASNGSHGEENVKTTAQLS
ncbi:MAG: ABC transporter ATP-binding protein [Synergistaceae bacterium]|jgi:subfamily B ATP-binding cassette protein MsbA|nr:ABC transporter ATP-binding protein/permease [Synergistaceae bacterium]MCK9435774.1 ABC transporter ATP-binding protein/permease [Synergistaceae bacterium]MDD2350350.1 ABC transporter ATP-binding protein [Synergistaceae bacterium]MDD3318900.1 ABC transporter ATP-binding protein [Synergistaceae bacterium]MDD3672167.1 ABC transporter ATP-binding protein [Synergistaceae bacterium]